MAKYVEASPKILENLEQGMTNKEAAEAAGVSETQFYKWNSEKAEFAEAVKRARSVGEKVAIRKVEATLLQLATGYEYEDVRTEYGSELNQQTGKYEPVIRKQVRTKKTVPASTEAIKFFLTNKAPEEWKNRLEQNTTGNLVTDLKVNYVQTSPEDANFPSSEDEVDAER